MCLLGIVGRLGVSWGILGCPGVIRLTDTRAMNYDLWTFRDQTCSWVVLSRPMIGLLTTRYFSHLFDLDGSLPSVIFEVARLSTVNYCFMH